MSTTNHNYCDETKIGFLAIGSGTNMRSMYCSILPDFPCGNSVATLKVRGGSSDILLLVSRMTSFVFDYIVRLRLTGINLNYFVIEEAPVLKPVQKEIKIERVANIAFASHIFSPEWIRLQSTLTPTRAWKSRFSITPAERIRVSSFLDAAAFGESEFIFENARFLLKDCDYSRGELGQQDLDPKGFWRVDKDKDPELRHTVLTLIAFRELESKICECGGDRQKGIEAFLTQNSGDGWMLPETVRLADYGLGHDDRAKEHQLVASRFGPRFYDWQLAQTSEESWRECHLHARNLLGEAGYDQLLTGIEAGKREEKPSSPLSSVPRKGTIEQGKLFSG